MAYTGMVTMPDGWTYSSVYPSIATHEDGRLMIWDRSERLILPAPAAAIWRDINFREMAWVAEFAGELNDG